VTGDSQQFEVVSLYKFLKSSNISALAGIHQVIVWPIDEFCRIALHMLSHFRRAP
jgi:hypothetical protein